MTDKQAVLPMKPELWQEVQRAARTEGMSASAYTRLALIDKLHADGYIMPGPAGAAIVPVIRYSVDYRSGDGSLNTEVVTGTSEADIRKVFDGSNVVSIRQL